MPGTFDEYRESVYSQNGEDGIIRELCDRLSIEDGTFCEFGAWDGKHLSNTYNLLEDGWSGLMIEGDPEKYEELRETARAFPERLHTRERYVDEEGEGSLDAILAESPIDDLDLVSIDVDGPDYFIWDSLEEHRPTVVLVEFNPYLGSEVRFISDLRPGSVLVPAAAETSYDPPFGDRAGVRMELFGTSFRSMVELGEEKGYTPVACTIGNLIFVDDAVVEDVGLSRREREDPSVLFSEDWVPSRRPFYERSLLENWRRLARSLREDGVRETASAVLRRLRRDLF